MWPLWPGRDSPFSRSFSFSLSLFVRLTHSSTTSRGPVARMPMATRPARSASACDCYCASRARNGENAAGHGAVSTLIEPPCVDGRRDGRTRRAREREGGTPRRSTLPDAPSVVVAPESGGGGGTDSRRPSYRSDSWRGPISGARSRRAFWSD